MDDDEPRRSRRATAFAVALLVTVLAAGLLVALLLLLVQELDCFDGDGGSPYVADDSPRAALCRTGGGVVGVLIPMAWLVGLVLAIIGVLRWTRRRSGTVVLVLALAAPLALPGLAFLGLTRPSGSCADDKAAAYREWVDGGADGPAPYDCDKY
jgi:hypothetical protein